MVLFFMSLRCSNSLYICSTSATFAVSGKHIFGALIFIVLCLSICCIESLALSRQTPLRPNTRLKLSCSRMRNSLSRGCKNIFSRVPQPTSLRHDNIGNNCNAMLILFSWLLPPPYLQYPTLGKNTLNDYSLTDLRHDLTV